MTTDLQWPSFSEKEVSVVFVLGGPGAGKGTQSAKLKSDFGFKHLSAGDLLRAEQVRPGSTTGAMIKDYIENGKIVPMEVTIKLLATEMQRDIDENTASTKRFLIDGFPRKMDQGEMFESTVVPSKFTLFFDCPEEVMEKRLLHRGETSGRADDNIEAIKKRFKTFVEQSMPVVDAYEKQNKVEKVVADKGPEDVYKDVVAAMERRGFHKTV